MEGEFSHGIQKQIDLLFGGRSNDLGRQVFLEFAEAFLSSIDGRMRTLSDSVTKRDQERITQMAHQLKGSYSTLGAEALTQACVQLEGTTSLQDQRIDIEFTKIMELTPHLCEHLRAIIAELRSLDRTNKSSL